MLKWTASVQKLNASEMPMPTPTTNGRIAAMRTPQQQQQRRQRRRATIGHNGCDKENMLPVTSTPIVPQPMSLLRMRNSPLVLAPLADILNVTPEHSPQTPHRGSGNGSGRRRRSVISTATTATPTPIVARSTRRHSTVGFSLPPPMTEYAPTLPCYEEEEYSPSTKVQLTGQELALRGLMPVPFLTTMRYFQTPELLSKQKQQQKQTQNESLKQKKSLPQKRKLEEEFAQIAEECSNSTSTRETAPKPTTTTTRITTLRRTQQPEFGNVTSTTSSAKMGDQTLDRLIDAILDSARKEEKRKKPRKSFNLRRRTLLKNQTVHEQREVLLSPSYAACDDPASDLSFLLCDTVLEVQPKTTPIHCRTSLAKLQQQPTPAPATPLPGTPIPLSVLQQMPTPLANFTTLTPVNKTLKAIANHSHDSFNLETPVRALNKRRRQQQQHSIDESGGGDLMGSASKKFKADAHNYFEVGLALPSIYV